MDSKQKIQKMDPEKTMELLIGLIPPEQLKKAMGTNDLIKPEEFLKLVFNISTDLVGHMLKGDEILIGQKPNFVKYEITSAGLRKVVS